jgi:ABC-type glutathione transport system ATPase component
VQVCKRKRVPALSCNNALLSSDNGFFSRGISEEDAKKAAAAAKAAKAKRQGKSAAAVAIAKEKAAAAAGVGDHSDTAAPLLLSVAVADDLTKPVPAVLRDLDFSVPTGELWAVIGRVGSGKTALCGAVMGELSKAKGTVVVNGKCAYVSQVSRPTTMSLFT